MSRSAFHVLATVATVLALTVVMLGAYVRLSDAGLGCPDWPGCFGQITWPQAADEIATANAAFPERPVVVAKAWREMAHRYLAGFLGLLVFALAILAWRNRQRPHSLTGLSSLLAVLILLQAALGMWTVTLKLSPLVVMGHLLGGMAIVGLLGWLTLRSNPTAITVSGGRGAARLRRIAVLSLLVLAAQIALGGWVSANYSALACPDLPTCQGQWWPPADWQQGFVLWREIGVDYEGGILDHDARVAIHLAHRVGFVVTSMALLALVLVLLRSRLAEARKPAKLVGIALLMQAMLGLLNVTWVLPLPVAVAHNGGAALLLLSVVFTLHRLRPRAYNL